jgi:hypothetical protein
MYQTMSEKNRTLSLITTISLAIVGSLIANYIDEVSIVPVLFALGIPLINIQTTLPKKIALTALVSIASSLILLLAVLTLLSFNFDKYLFPGLVVGLAGVAFLAVNSALIRSLRPDWKSYVLTFILSGISIPLWVYLSDNVFPQSLIDIAIFRESGAMILWMLLTTIGTCSAIPLVKEEY